MMDSIEYNGNNHQEISQWAEKLAPLSYIGYGFDMTGRFYIQYGVRRVQVFPFDTVVYLRAERGEEKESFLSVDEATYELITDEWI